jgi:hypothetical protein
VGGEERGRKERIQEGNQKLHYIFSGPAPKEKLKLEQEHGKNKKQG